MKVQWDMDAKETRRWSNDEKYFTQFEYDPDPLKVAPASFVLYDLASQKRFVLGKAPDYYTWQFDSSKLFLSDSSGVSVIDNISEVVASDGVVMPNVRRLENLRSCNNIAYAFGQLYCSIDSAAVPNHIPATDQKNIEMLNNNLLIISQSLDQADAESFKVVSKGAFSSVGRIMPIDRKSLAIAEDDYYQTYRFLLNLESGLEQPLAEKETIFRSSEDPTPYIKK